MIACVIIAHIIPNPGLSNLKLAVGLVRGGNVQVLTSPRDFIEIF